MIHKILVGILLTISTITSQAQIIGGNGEGISSAYSNEDVPYLLELTKTHPIAIRWPGGGDSKVSFLDINKPGLGMNKDSIENLYAAFPDKNGNIKYDKLEKDLRKVEADQEEPESALMQVIRMSRSVKDLQVDYCLNVLQGNVETNLGAIQTLLDSGVNIISIVAGNETFYSYFYNWQRYQNDFEPLLKECQKRWPEIPRFICIGQELTRKDHIQWNNKLIEYVNANGNFISGVDVHYYLMEEIKEALMQHPKSFIYKSDEYYPELEAAFSKYIELYRKNDEFGGIINYLKLNLPGKIYHCTEFNDKEAEYWSNTVANSAHIFSTFCKYRNEFKILLVQNLIGQWFWASRRPANNKLDMNPEKTEKINRVQWYAIQLANELPFDTKELAAAIKITQPGIYYYYFDNAGNKKFSPDIDIKKGTLTSSELHYVTGKYNYSSAGGTGFMAKGSDPSMEVKGITISASDKIENIPYNSFGYLKLIVK